METVLVEEPNLFYASEGPQHIDVCVSGLVQDADPSWITVRDRLAGREYAELIEIEHDSLMMFGSATRHLYLFTNTP